MVTLILIFQVPIVRTSGIPMAPFLTSCLLGSVKLKTIQDVQFIFLGLVVYTRSWQCGGSCEWRCFASPVNHILSRSQRQAMQIISQIIRALLNKYNCQIVSFHSPAQYLQRWLDSSDAGTQTMWRLISLYVSRYDDIANFADWYWSYWWMPCHGEASNVGIKLPEAKFYHEKRITAHNNVFSYLQMALKAGSAAVDQQALLHCKLYRDKGTKVPIFDTENMKISLHVMLAVWSLWRRYHTRLRLMLAGGCERQGKLQRNCEFGSVRY